MDQGTANILFAVIYCGQALIAAFAAYYARKIFVTWKHQAAYGGEITLARETLTLVYKHHAIIRRLLRLIRHHLETGNQDDLGSIVAIADGHEGAMQESRDKADTIRAYLGDNIHMTFMDAVSIIEEARESVEHSPNGSIGDVGTIEPPPPNHDLVLVDNDWERFERLSIDTVESLMEDLRTIINDRRPAL